MEIFVSGCFYSASFGSTSFRSIPCIIQVVNSSFMASSYSFQPALWNLTSGTWVCKWHLQKAFNRVYFKWLCIWFLWKPEALITSEPEELNNCYTSKRTSWPFPCLIFPMQMLWLPMLSWTKLTSSCGSFEILLFIQWKKMVPFNNMIVEAFSNCCRLSLVQREKSEQFNSPFPKLLHFPFLGVYSVYSVHIVSIVSI